MVIQGAPYYGSVGGLDGIHSAYKNVSQVSLAVTVIAVWKNSLGQASGVTTASAQVLPGTTEPFFDPLSNPPVPGPYTVNVFALDTVSGTPLSTETSFQVTI